MTSTAQWTNDRAEHDLGGKRGLVFSGSTLPQVAGSQRDDDRDAHSRDAAPSRSNPTVTQLREERNAHERAVYEARKLAGLCTRCGEPALEDGQLCAEHRTYERERTQVAIETMRKARRAAGCCIRCGRKSKRAECVACLVRAGRLPRSAVPKSNPTVTQARVDVIVEADGYERRRFVGQGRKGAPSKATLDRMDFKDIAKAVAKFVEQVHGGYKLVDEGKLLPGDADAVAAAALDQLALASRFIDDILDRHRYGEAVRSAGKLRAQGAKVRTGDVAHASRPGRPRGGR